MGYRIHKCLGFGLIDVEYDEETHNIVDERFNEHVNEGDFFGRSGREYIKWLQNNEDEAVDLLVEFDILSSRSSAKSVYRDILKGIDNAGFRPPKPAIYRTHFGLSNVLLIQSLIYPEWSRSDDSIDYYEEYASHSSANNRIECRVVDLFETSHTSIFPYSASVRRFPDVDVAPDFIPEGTLYYDNLKRGVMGVGDYNIFLGRWDPEREAQANAAMYRHLIDDWGPTVPSEVLAYVKWADVFKNFSTAYRMRPLLYVYWA